LDPPKTTTEGRRVPENMWRTPNVRGTNSIPLFIDCATIGVTIWPEDRPPDYDGQFLPYTGNNYDEMKRVCVNRHDGSVNSLFLDYAVRRVGLKELWTLKWHRKYDQTGPWTIGGNVRPTDWPEWMRSFKDY